MIIIDKLCYQSGLRYVNAAEKCAYTLLGLVICIVSRSYLAAMFVFAVNGILTVGIGKIPVSRYIKLLLIPGAFLLAGTLALFIDVGRTPLDAFAIPVGGWYITGSFASIKEGARLCTTAMASVACLYFLALNTTMTDILEVLKKLHLPALIIELMLLIYRFIFVFLETASAIMTAQESRLGNRNFRTRIRSFGGMGAALFVLALKRANALYDAMESRCYDGRIRVLSQERPPRKKEIALIVLFALAAVGLAVAG